MARTVGTGGLVLVGVSAGYGETIVLEGIALDLPPGGTLALLGRNGVGKTTLAGHDHGPHAAARRVDPLCRP